MRDTLSGIGAFFLGIFLLFISFAGVIIVMGLLWAIPTMLLWDWLMPEIFGLTTITIWQAWGLNILAGIFFKNKGKKKTKTDTKTGKKEISYE